MTSELHSVQLKVASGTETITVQLLDSGGKLVPAEPSGATTIALVVTTDWQTFEQLWDTAARVVNPNLDTTYKKWCRNRAVAGTLTSESFDIVAIRPLCLRGLTVPIQLNYGGFAEDDVKTYSNGDYLVIGPVPFGLLPKPRGVYGRRVQIVHTNLAELHTALDMVFAPVAISNLMRDIDAEGYLSGMSLWDKSNTPQISAHDLTFDFWKSNVTLAAAGAAFAASDTEALEHLGGFTIDSTEWKDVAATGQRFTMPANDDRLGIHLLPRLGTRDVYVSAYTEGTPTPASTTDLIANYSVIDA